MTLPKPMEAWFLPPLDRWSLLVCGVCRTKHAFYGRTQTRGFSEHRIKLLAATSNHRIELADNLTQLLRADFVPHFSGPLGAVP